MIEVRERRLTSCGVFSFSRLTFRECLSKSRLEKLSGTICSARRLAPRFEELVAPIRKHFDSDAVSAAAVGEALLVGSLAVGVGVVADMSVDSVPFVDAVVSVSAGGAEGSRAGDGLGLFVGVDEGECTATSTRADEH